MKELAESLIKMAEELAPELSKGHISYSHSEILQLLTSCAQLRCMQEIKNELCLMNQEARFKANPLSLLRIPIHEGKED